MLTTYTTRVKKKKLRLNHKSLKIRKIIKLLSVDDSTFIFLSWYIGHSYNWVRDGYSAIIFEKHVKAVFVQVLSLLHNAVQMHELLLCCESSHKYHHAAQTTPPWRKQFWHVLQNLLLYSHPWPNMNEQCTKWKYNNYAIMHWNQLCCIFFWLWAIWSQTRVSFLF